MLARNLSIKLAGIFIVLIIAGYTEAKLNCAKIRSFYRCIATDRDGADKFVGTIKNIYSSDIIIDIKSVVDTCEKIADPPFRSLSNHTQTELRQRGRGERQESSTALLRQKDLGIKIKKGGQQILNMERVKAAGYCSKSIIMNCRTASIERIDCSQLISIN